MEAFIAARSAGIGEALIGFSGAWLGVLVGPILGVILFKTILRGTLSISEFLVVSGVSVGAGFLAATFLPPPGWQAGGATILVAVISTTLLVYRRRLVHAKSNQESIN